MSIFFSFGMCLEFENLEKKYFWVFARKKNFVFVGKEFSKGKIHGGHMNWVK